MNKIIHLTTVALLIAFMLFKTTNVLAAAFQSGDVVVLQVGDGSTALGSTAAPTFLDEYNGSTLVQSIPLPIAASGNQSALTVGGNQVAEGQLELSPNGQYLTVLGYNATVGSAAPSGVSPTIDNRVVGVATANGSVDTSTSLGTSTMTGNARGVMTDNGTEFWVSTSSGGIFYAGSLGATSATSLGTPNTRNLGIFNGQLYASVASTTGTGNGFGISQVGSGLPTSSASLSLLPGFLNNNTGSSKSAFGFFMADLNNDGILDTAWIADSTTGSGIQRWAFNGSSWTLQYTLATGAAEAVTVNLSGANPTVYATTTGGNLDEVVDTGASSTVNVLATAGANEIFRGIAFAPQSVPEPQNLLAFGGLGILTWRFIRRRR